MKTPMSHTYKRIRVMSKISMLRYEWHTTGKKPKALARHEARLDRLEAIDNTPIDVSIEMEPSGDSLLLTVV